MGTLAQIQEKGLNEEFEGYLAAYLTEKSTDDHKKGLLTLIDENGLKASAVMRQISTLQKEGVLTNGLYKELVKLNAKMTNGEASAAPAEKEDKSFTEDEEGNLIFSEKQEEKIAARMEKEREKLQKRLLDKELKIRERLAGRAEKRATRLGMKTEEAKEIMELREQIATIREEIKTKREEVKAMQTRIREIRPKRPRKTKEEKEAEKAAKAAEKEAAKAEAAE